MIIQAEVNDCLDHGWDVVKQCETSNLADDKRVKKAAKKEAEKATKKKRKAAGRMDNHSRGAPMPPWALHPQQLWRSNQEHQALTRVDRALSCVLP